MDSGQNIATTRDLGAKTGEQWPATEPNMPLFPGYCADGQKRCWDKPISARAYLGEIHAAARSLTQDKTAAAAIGVKHAFQDFPLHKLGTHSMKKTAVTLMAEAAVSWSIISGVTGTSVRMLQNTYDISTPSRYPNMWLRKGNPLISGKSRLVKSYHLAMDFNNDSLEIYIFFPASKEWASCFSYRFVQIPVG